MPIPRAPNPDDGGEKRSFVSEPLTPEADSGSTEAMSRGEPAAPRRFAWRDRHYEIESVESSWKGHGTDRGDTYVRRHWFDIVTTCGVRMRIYFDRNPGRSGSKRSRWWVYSVSK